MQMIALSKCDGYPRIFFNAGTTPAEQAEYTALTPATGKQKKMGCGLDDHFW
jgi:hypothetical protein